VKNSKKKELQIQLDSFAASSGNLLLTFRDDILVRCSEFKNPIAFLNPDDGTDILSRTPVRNYHYSLRNNPEEHSSQLLRGGSLISRVVLIVYLRLHKQPTYCPLELNFHGNYDRSPR
jgi:hypothetical protein